MMREQMRIGLLPVRSLVVLPSTVAHFDLSISESIHAVQNALQRQTPLFLVLQHTDEKDIVTKDHLEEIGVIAEVKQVIKLQQGVVRVLVEGLERARLDETDYDGAKWATVTPLPLEEQVDEHLREAMREALWDATAAFVPIVGKKVEDFRKTYERFEDPIKLIYQFASELPFSFEKRQQVLDAMTLAEAYETMVYLLLNAADIQRIKKDFEAKVKERIDENQREYILREQLKLIKEELGEDQTESELNRLREETEALDADEEVKEKLRKEINRLSSLGGVPSESAVSRTYIETLLSLPWNKMSEDNNDLNNAEAILDEDHYGLEKVKERILEFLAVRALTNKGESPIICLVGPPGTGKTSIARSVAKALEKEYVRISLGGVRDEAEIRGHRRTYVGAMPGRIAQALIQAGVKNPLMLLDEVDKAGSDYKSDAFSALLEVLDPDQNSRFSDHYVELPIDLSEALFVTTANTTQTIPAPLLDRMEIIPISGYTENEKYHIASEHLVQKQLEKNGLSKRQLKFRKNALEKMIRAYTREAGVRTLERTIGQVCRKVALDIMKNGEESAVITAANLPQYLGKEKYSYKKINKKSQVGIVRGLAWTSVGGVTLQVEVNVMPGKGALRLTGQLGDVMKESATAGISYIRSISEKYRIPKEYFMEHDIHVHIPEGATPKDGPSAGITMATAILSAATGIAVRNDVAMTGEITLRGRVLPIGGLKEKLLAAQVAGMKTVLVPKENKADVTELSEEITKGLRIVFVEKMEEVLKEALVED